MDLTDDPSERMSLLESLAQAVDKTTASLSPDVATHLQTLVHDRLRAEHQVEADYSRLSSFAGTDAKTRAARADVRGVEKVIARVQAEDERLGHQRPERVAALLASVRDELDSARRLRLARDQWSVKIGTYRSYRRAVSAPLASLDLIASSLDDIKRLAGPEATELPRLLQRVAQVLRALASIVPPSDLAPVHTLIESAARLAEQAVLTRKVRRRVRRDGPGLAGLVGRRGRADAARSREARHRERDGATGRVVVTERRTRLHRAPSLPAFRAVLTAIVPVDDLAAARATAVLVPSRTAADLLAAHARGSPDRRVAARSCSRISSRVATGTNGCTSSRASVRGC